MKRILFITLILLFAFTAGAQLVRPFTPRYSNPSVRGNIVYVSNSIIASSGMGAGVNEMPSSGSSTNNGALGINIDIDGGVGAGVTKLPFASVWDYYSSTNTPLNDGTAKTWNAVGYALTGAAWNTGGVGTGTGSYGWGGVQNTCIPNGCPDCAPKGSCAARYSASYFRNTTLTFTAAELSTVYSTIRLNLKRNDGVVIYVNGVERARDNMPAGVPVYATYATAAIAPGAAENYTVDLNPAFFVAGSNTIAVEIHSDKLKADGVNFDMEVLGIPVDVSGTFNSSSADLALATSCNQILFAGLYWGADQGASGTNVSWITPNYSTVKLKLPGSSTYTTLTSQQSDIHSAANSPGLPHTGYLCFRDITSLINTANPNGTYTVADVVGPIGITNACGGWTIVIAYANPSLLPRNLTVFDGSAIINGGDPAIDVNINGFLTPPSGPVSCELGAVVYDGDRGSTDSFAFKQNGAGAFYNLASIIVPLNGTNDAWNSKISYKGSVVTTRNPAYLNTAGYDASIINLPNTLNGQLGNNQTGATVRFASPGENYFVHVLTTSISQFSPSFSFSKSSTDINGGILTAGDSVRYTINYNNVGNDTSTNTVIVDNIPLGTSYLPSSLRINGVAKTDASTDDQAEFELINNRVVFRLGTGANGTTGGSILLNGSGTIQFDVVLASSCKILNCSADSVRNTAKIMYTGKTSGAALYDSSGVNVAGCIEQRPIVNFVSGPCSLPSDTILVNACPVTSVNIPWRRYAGYTLYSAQPFIPSNIYNPLTPVTSSHVYWALFDNGAGCSDTLQIRVFIIACPDIDDDNDGIPDYVEINNPLALQDANSNGIPNWSDPTYPGFIDNNADGINDRFDPSADEDNDGIINFYDINFAGYVDSNGDGVNDNMDKDRDGIPNHLDLDCDNDGIPDVVESYGVDQDGNGIIDNYSTSDNDGFSQNVDASTTGVTGSGNGLGAQDFDLDGVPNYLDTDSDNDGIPDVVEALGPDTNNDGYIDGYNDSDGDGLSDNVDSDIGNDGVSENTSISLLRTGADSNGDGRADSYPFKNMDNQSKPNPYDLDSDMDGITDVIEAGFIDANYDGFVDGPRGADGWNLALNSQAALNVRNSDGFSGPDYLDIDADDDGIPDNVEGMTTLGYQFPTYIDADGDGIDNRYDNNLGVVGGPGIFPADKDGDSIPDYLDLDTDSDGILDIVEGNDFNLNGIWDDIVSLTYMDTDGDGLDNRFDSLNSVTNIRGTSYRMGPLGILVGDPNPGTRSPVQKRIASQTERDWRYVSYVLPLPLLTFTGSQYLGNVTLNWSVITPVQLDKFEIERSTDNAHFKTIGTKAAAIPVNEMKEFNAADDITSLNSELIFYRLKVLAQNGQEKYSDVIVMRKGAAKMNINIHPNPATDHVTVSFNSDKEVNTSFVVNDYAGRQVLVQKQKLMKGNNIIPITGLSKFPDGVYNVQVIINNEVVTQKLIIRN